MFINQKGSPLLHFSALCDIFRKKFFSKIPSFFPKKMFCAFWALDIAPTWDVPVLFKLFSHGWMNSFVVGLIISFVSTFKRLVISWSIKQFGTNCRFLQMGRIVAFSKWDELTLGTNCRFLKFGTNCRLGRIVAQPQPWSWQALRVFDRWALGGCIPTIRVLA